MRIDEIQIEKFRTFKKCNIRLNDINAIVGENNSGKTAILKALNAFFILKRNQIILYRMHISIPKVLILKYR